MTIMTTNVTPPVKTVKDQEKAGINPVKSAISTPSPSQKLAETKATVAAPPVQEKLTFHKDKFSAFELVRLTLKQSGCIQYDPAYPELVLDTCDKRGKILPLTPFFKSRIGVTLEIVFK